MQNNTQPSTKHWGFLRIIKYIVLVPITLFVIYTLGYFFVYTPIVKFIDHQNFIAAERDIDAIYNAIPADEKILGDVKQKKTCEDTSYGLSNQEIICTLKITAKYPVSTPGYANEIADKYLEIIRKSGRIKEFVDNNEWKSLLRKEFLNGSYNYSFKTLNSSLRCEMLFFYSNGISSDIDGTAINGEVHLSPSIYCYGPAQDFWYDKIL